MSSELRASESGSGVSPLNEQSRDGSATIAFAKLCRELCREHLNGIEEEEEDDEEEDEDERVS